MQQGCNLSKLASTSKVLLQRAYHNHKYFLAGNLHSLLTVPYATTHSCFLLDANGTFMFPPSLGLQRSNPGVCVS